jgi:UDP-N-acetylglucosamine 1-carboxyvinyltransferase
LLAALFCPNTLFYIKKIRKCGDVISVIEWIKSNNLAEASINKTFLNFKIKSFPDITDIRGINSIRSSICLLSPLALLGRKVIFKEIGGCNFTDRPINRHLDLAMELGIKIVEHHGYFEAFKIKQKKLINFDCSVNGLISVGVTAHALLAALVFHGKIVLNNISIDPSIITMIEIIKNKFKVDADFAKRTIRIDTSIPNTTSDNNIKLEIPTDYTEALTYIFSVLSTGGRITIVNEADFPEPFHVLFNKMNIEVDKKNNTSTFSSGRLTNPKIVSCTPTPGIPTDCGPILTAMLCSIDGECAVIDTVYNNRDSHIFPLQQMGYNVNFSINTSYTKGSKPNDGHLIIRAADIRAGAAILVGALNKKGRTTIQNAKEIQRGYSNIADNLKKIGANIYIGEER